MRPISAEEAARADPSDGGAPPTGDGALAPAISDASAPSDGGIIGRERRRGVRGRPRPEGQPGRPCLQEPQ